MQSIAITKKVKIGGNKIKAVPLLQLQDECKSFVKQVTREDVLINMLNGYSFKQIMNDNDLTIVKKTRQGFLYETIWEILIALRCIEKLDYNEIYEGVIENLTIVKKYNKIIKKNIVQGKNPADMIIKQGTTMIPISIKYKEKFLPNTTQVSELENSIKLKTDDYKVGFIVKDKNPVIIHTYINTEDPHKIAHDKVIDNGLLFDKHDINLGMEVFRERFTSAFTTIYDFIEMIDRDYLLNPRKQLVKWQHQKMNLEKIITQILNGEKKHLISQMPRSGKSILILLICKYLLENGRKRILIMSSVRDTLESFANDLDNYLDFKSIKYIKQEEFCTIDPDFIGIVFCSVQYLKMDTTKQTKKEMLKHIGFDAVFDDECHLGGSTDKTKKNILDVVEKGIVDTDIDEIYKVIPLIIFASGTSEKTRKFYKIKSSCIYSWDMTDVSYMKELLQQSISQPKKDDIIDLMRSFHGEEFYRCLQDLTLNKDYSAYPTQVLMKYSIPDRLKIEIKEYNIKYGTNYGFSCATLFSLYQSKNEETGVIEYEERFELSNSN